MYIFIYIYINTYIIMDNISTEGRNALKKRRDDLFNLSRSTIFNFNNINKYEISLEKLEYLENENKDLKSYKNSLENINKELKDIYDNKIPNAVTNSNDYEGVAEVLKRKGQYVITNNKVASFEVDMDSNFLYSARVIHSHGNVFEYNNSNINKPNNFTTTKYNFENNEFLNKIALYNNDTNQVGIVLTTSKNKEKKFVPKNMSINKNDYGTRKSYVFWIQYYIGRDYYNIFKSNPGGWNLASINSQAENNWFSQYFTYIRRALPQYPFNKVYLGGKRTPTGEKKGFEKSTNNLTWKWLDGTEWTNFNTNNAFARSLGRPDGGGNFITYIVDPDKSYHGKWDDDDGNGRFPVLLSKTTKTTLKTVEYAAPADQQMVFFSPNTIKKYTIDKTAVNEAKKMVKVLKKYRISLDKYGEDIQSLINGNNETIKIINRDIRENEQVIEKIKKLNNVEGFSNNDNFSMSNIFNKIFNIFNIKENMENDDYNSPYYDKRKKNVYKVMSSINDELELTDQFEFNQNRNTLLELATQQNNLFSNMVMDYITNGQNGSSIEDVYEKYDQETADKIRNVNINTYKSKTLTEYSNIVKTIIVIVIIMILLIILKSRGILGKNLTLSLIILAITIILLFVLHSSYKLYMKDKYNFDKATILFDPNANENDNENDNNNNNNTDSNNMNQGCAGELCCTDNMFFDTEDQKCKLNT